MAGLPPPPPGVKFTDPPAPAGVTFVDEPGSVFDKPSTGTSLKRIGKAAVKLGVGAGLPIAAGMALGPEASVPARIGAQAVAGAISPYAEYVTSRLTGEHPQVPGIKDALKSAAFNAAFAAPGEALAARAGRAAKVAGEIRALPAEAQTGANVKQALQNREVWKRLGLNDQQIDAAIESPELQAEMARNIAAGKDYKGAFQATLDSTRSDFHARYDKILGPYADTKIDAVPIGQQFEALAQGTGQHELTPTFRGFLQRKGLELTHAGESGGPSVGGVPWKQLPETLKEQIRAQGGAQGVKAPSTEMGIQQIRDLRTELRENLPASATNLDKQAYNQLLTQLNGIEQNTLKHAGATPEQIGALSKLDEEYGTFQQTVKALDPRSERFGTDVAKLLWTNVAKNPADAVNFIRMAESAESLRPGEVMPALRASFMENAIAETRSAAQGRPIEEMRLLQKLQTQYGGDKNLRAVTDAMFGKGNPISNPTTLARALGQLSKPDQVAADAAKGVSPFHVPTWLLRLGVSYSMYGALTGSIASPWTDMHKNPARFLTGMAALYASTAFASKVFTYGDRKVQSAYVNFLLNPSADSLKTFSTVAGGIASGVSSMPTPQEVAAER